VIVTPHVSCVPLQSERLRRMLGDGAESAPKTLAHMSADDLNDGFILDKADKETLTYKVSVCPARGGGSI